MKVTTGLVLVLLAPLVLLVVPLAGESARSCTPGGSQEAVPVSVTGQASSSLDAGQRAHAAVVIDAALDRRLGTQGAVIGVMAALTESSLRNLGHGDAAGPDSRGLFQQRTSWGPMSVRMNPVGASGLFFDALQAVPGWRSMRPWMAAQAVQQSAFADGSNYRTNYATAARLVTNTLSQPSQQRTVTAAHMRPVPADASTGACAPGLGVASAPVRLPPTPVPYRGGSTGCTVADPTGTGGCVTGATAHLLAQTRAAFGTWPWGVSCWDEHAWSPNSDHPLGKACDYTVGRLGRFPNAEQERAGWSLAQWYRTNANRLHVDYVIFDGRIWSTTYADDGWRPYDGGGIYDPASVTGGHHDHLHVSLEN